MKKGINTQNELKVKQVNPKFRTFLLIFCNWLWIIFFWLTIGGFDPYLLKISVIYDSDYLPWIFLSCFLVTFFYSAWWSNYRGIKYLPRDVTDYYLQKNSNYVKENSNLKIDEVTNLFNVIPICKEAYPEKIEIINKDTFVKLSQIEKSKNRLVVNGKIDHYDFSWGIISRVKKRNLRFYFFIFLYYGPLFGFFWLFVSPFNLNSTALSTKTNGTFGKYKRLGCSDLIAKNLGQKNSESYLIFAAKLKNPISTVTLIPKTDDIHQNSEIKNQYDWPTSLSKKQKEQLQNLIQNIDFLPSIYVSQDDISIVMKKYDYNKKDDGKFETWELLKQKKSDSDVQFKSLENALKIYNIFNLENVVNKEETE